MDVNFGSSLVADALAGVPPKRRLRQVRVCWQLEPMTTEGGRWGPLKWRKFLEAWVDSRNRKFGAGTHWLEFRDA